MKKNNVTIKDVAKEAGVSVATVSYVINNNKEQSISEETKQKIWQVVNMLNYKPNVYAKSLRMRPNSRLIAVCSDSINPLYKAEYMLILENLFEVFSNSYGLLFQSKPTKDMPNVDAIISYNVSKEKFYEIGNLSYVPLIAIDSNINDPLFFQITSDYNRLKLMAEDYFKNDFTFVDLKPFDTNLENDIKSCFNNTLLISKLDDLEKIKDTNILTTSYTIYSYLKSKNINALFDNSLLKGKCQQAFSCVKLALSHEPFDIHNYKI